ncbi:uncharacterized protein [Nothobranchius furzeri]|uniref:LOC107376953-like protein n=1 Tax=Nothobranchius furzeri TaxID=105023 RepID=A0A9D3C5L6_NOTFU|nr:putative LOC107376953-like protein [Nothobranchius furzeri]
METCLNGEVTLARRSKNIMYPSALLMFDEVNSDRFTTTYNKDFGPHAWKKIRTQPAAPRAPPRNIHTYGSAVGAQNPPGSFSLSSTFCNFTPSIGCPVGRVGSTLSDGAVRVTGLSFDGDQHCCICDNDRKIFSAAETKPPPNPRSTTYACDDLKCLHQESNHLSLPVPRSIFTQSPNIDADDWKRSLWGLDPVLQLKSRTNQQSCYGQCIFCEREDEPVVPLPSYQSTTQPVDHPQQRSLRWKPPLTEYQAQFAAQWPQPGIQRKCHPPPCHRNVYPFKL